ncbi:lysophospholipid acyltransferase family protein [Abyssibacter sp.]|uniref:lysophospholipid acyltransferase family protein n=1 Tax=Abyssibacter sp. TaxID=2320200 RepID=UPI0025C1195A|nr:lysophospholipid acyltransferase family protein [Abyssibacter sp.]MCK5859902.1 acyltransferase family protein [Abyssibacter sp.]
MAISRWLADRIVGAEIHDTIDRLPKVLGSFGFDPWGYNRSTAKLSLAGAGWLFDHYFRVRVEGLEHIPPTGRVMMVPNHSGQLPLDGVMLGVAMARNPAGPRAPRAMIERFFPTVPFLGNFMNGLGAVVGDPVNCGAMLEHEEAIIVFPEGIRGSGKVWHKRYQLQRFGTGFMHLAMRHRTPIVPVGIVGCEETMPSFSDLKPLARPLGLPYIPLGPLLPLPARVSLHIGEPLRFDNDCEHEHDIAPRIEQVKSEIRKLIRRGLEQRQSIYR